MKAKFKAGSKVNRKYKDSVFSLLLSDEKTIAEVYGAISGKDYGPDVKVEIKTLKNVLSSGMFNDVAFVLDNRLVVLIEHQSTINENMPLRMLLYIAEIYNRLSTDENLYDRKMFTIPRPIFIMLYNGVEDMPEKWELKLSDMFKDVGDAENQIDLELTVTAYNINKGCNLEMARRSHTLNEYETFIYMVRENEKTMDFEDAVRKAVIDCINQNVLKEFLENHKKEVIGMLTQEWSLEKAIAFAERDARQVGLLEGRREGERQNALKTAKRLRDIGRMTVDEIAEATDLTVDDILRL